MIIYSLKESEMKYFTLSLSDSILCEICNEQRHKESKFRYFTLSINDYVYTLWNLLWTKAQRIKI